LSISWGLELGVPMLTGRMGYAAALLLIALVSTTCINGGETDISYKAAINDHFKPLPFASGPSRGSFPSRQPLLMTRRPRAMMR
jgi:hypothetical protein